MPETAGIDGASTRGELATRMRETGFSRESATSLISFDAVVRWVKVELEGERRYRRVPRMLLEEETATATEMIKFAGWSANVNSSRIETACISSVNARRRATM